MSAPGWRPAVLVTGGRDYVPREHAHWFKHWLRAVRPAFVLHGGARGVDLWAEAIARAQGVDVRRDAVTDDDWKRHGRAAAPMRNSALLEAMLQHGGGYCIVFNGGEGTADMKGKAERGGLTVVNMQTPLFKPPEGQREMF